MAADVVGEGPWTARKSLAATMANGNLTITGVDNRLSVTLKVFDAAPGSFTAVSGELVPAVEALFTDDLTFSYASAKGGVATVVITELTESRVVGTFDFVAFAIFADARAMPQYHFANGTFNVRLR
jgi:hypothetical protein